MRRRHRFDWDGWFIELAILDDMVLHRHGRDRGGAIEMRWQVLERHASIDLAKTEFERLLAEALRNHADDARTLEEDDGHALRDLIAAAGSQLATNAALERECLEAPAGDATPWSVYADWWMGHGDPRGQLAALHVQHEADAAMWLFAHYRALFLGDLPIKDVGEAITWRHGFPVGVRLRVERDLEIELAPIVAQFLALPFARFIESIRFGLADPATAGEGTNDWGPVLAAVLASVQAPRIRELRFDDYASEDNEISWTGFGDLSAVDRLPALEVLHIRCGTGDSLGALHLPELRTFVRESGGLPAKELAAIAAAHWPKLEHLEIWTGASRFGAEATIEMLAPILRAEGVPELRHLGLVNSELSDALIPALASSTILPQLRTLDLSKGVMTELAAARLVEQAAAFAHLEVIDLRDNLLRADELARIAAVLPRVLAGDQRPYDDERYVAVGE